MSPLRACAAATGTRWPALALRLSEGAAVRRPYRTAATPRITRIAAATIARRVNRDHERRAQTDRFELSEVSGDGGLGGVMRQHFQIKQARCPARPVTLF